MDDNDALRGSVSDPATDGLPETADDDSYADDVREAGRDPGGTVAALPPDREDGPVGLDTYGTTSNELRRGEPLEFRLAREEPDMAARRAAEDPSPALAQDVDPDATGQLTEDTRLLTETDPVDPRLGSPVSMYDRPVTGIPYGASVGHLEAPGGGYTSRESDEIAYDIGPGNGGFAIEDLAMHIMPRDQVDLEEFESTSEPYVAMPLSMRVWHVSLR